MDTQMRLLAEHFNLKLHKVRCFVNGLEEEISLWTTVDLEVHTADDQRVYLVDVSRFFPPTMKFLPEAEEKCSGWRKSIDYEVALSPYNVIQSFDSLSSFFDRNIT
jgi:hypothetical protein